VIVLSSTSRGQAGRVKERVLGGEEATWLSLQPTSGKADFQVLLNISQNTVP
jgi:hypothetical protein